MNVVGSSKDAVERTKVSSLKSISSSKEDAAAGTLNRGIQKPKHNQLPY